MNIEAGERSIMEVPKEFAARMTRAGGRNRFGEPIYRVVWGWSRMGWIGRDGHCWREPKYLDNDKWILEKWQAPETYGDRQSWAKQFADLGPFPSRGEYEFVTDFKPVALTSKVADFLVRVIEASANASSADRREALQAREAKKERDWDRWADDMLDDSFEAFHGVPHVVVP